MNKAQWNEAVDFEITRELAAQGIVNPWSESEFDCKVRALDSPLQHGEHCKLRAYLRYHTWMHKRARAYS